MKFVRQIAVGFALAGISTFLPAQSSAPAAARAEVSFQVERPGMPVPRFTLRVEEDGTGGYQAEEVEGLVDNGAAQYASAKHIDQTISLSPETVTKIFRTARELDRFKMECDSKKKNIANTGEKTLSYTGPDGAGSCVYNYSDNKDVMMLTNTFLAIAFTMDEGRKLEFLHRYDRLGLDAEMTALQEAAKSGQALELGTIAPVLTSIAGDMAVMERVRLRASKLLEQAKGIHKI
jgi:hypothetical protein